MTKKRQEKLEVLAVLVVLALIAVTVCTGAGVFAIVAVAVAFAWLIGWGIQELWSLACRWRAYVDRQIDDDQQPTSWFI